MRNRTAAILGSIALSVLVNMVPAFGEEQAQQQAQAEANTQWVWGDVSNVDPQNKVLTLKYLDYETDQEKEMAIAVDSLTAYENVNSLEDIQNKDVVSVDYKVSDGKNIAKNISVEKPESQAPQEDK